MNGRQQLKEVHPRLSSSPLLHSLPECEALSRRIETTNTGGTLSSHELVALQLLPRKDAVTAVKSRIRSASTVRQADIAKDRRLLTYRVVQAINVALYESHVVVEHMNYGREQQQRWDTMREQVERTRSAAVGARIQKQHERRERSELRYLMKQRDSDERDGMVKSELRARAHLERCERRTRHDVRCWMRQDYETALHMTNTRELFAEEYNTREATSYELWKEREQIPRRLYIKIEAAERATMAAYEKGTRTSIQRILQRRNEWHAHWQALFQTVTKEEVAHRQKVADEEGLMWLDTMDALFRGIADYNFRMRMEAERRQKEYNDFLTILAAERRGVVDDERDVRQNVRNEEASLRADLRNEMWAHHQDAQQRQQVREECEHKELLEHFVQQQTPVILEEQEMRTELGVEEVGDWSAILSKVAQMLEDVTNPIDVGLAASCTHVLHSIPVPLLSSMTLQRKPYTAQASQLVASCLAIVSITEASALPEDMLDLNCVEVASVKEKVKAAGKPLRLVGELLYDEDNSLLGGMSKISAQAIAVKAFGPDANLFSCLVKMLQSVTFRTDSVCMLARTVTIKLYANFSKEPVSPRTRKAKHQSFFQKTQVASAFAFDRTVTIEVACIPPIFYLPPDKRLVSYDVRRKPENQKLVVHLLDGIKIDSTPCRDYRNGQLRMKVLEGYVKEDTISFTSNESIQVKKNELRLEDKPVGRIISGKLQTGAASNSSREFVIQFEDVEINPAFIERFLSRFLFWTTNVNSEINRRLIEVVLQEGPSPNKMSNSASIHVEVIITVPNETIVDLKLVDGDGIRFYRVSSTLIPPQLAHHVVDDPCRVMPNATASTLSLLKLNGAQCKISIKFGLATSVDTLELRPSLSEPIQVFAGGEGLTTIRYNSDHASYVFGTARFRDGALTCELCDGDVNALQALLRAVHYVPAGPVTFASLKTICVELTTPDTGRKKISVFKAQMGLMVTPCSVCVPYANCFVGLDDTRSLKLLSAYEVPADEANFLHFDGGTCTVEVLEGTSNDVIDIVPPLPVVLVSPQVSVTSASMTGTWRGTLSPAASAAPRLSKTMTSLMPMYQPSLDSADPNSHNAMLASRAFSAVPLFDTVSRATLSEGGDVSDKEDNDSDDGSASASPPPRTERTAFELSGMQVVASAEELGTKVIMHHDNIVAMFEPGSRVVFRFPGSKRTVQPIGYTPHSIHCDIVQAILSQVGYRQVEEENATKNVLVTLEDTYGGRSRCVCELNVLPGSEMTEILISNDKLLYRPGDPEMVGGALRILPDTRLEDPDTTNVEEGYLLVDPLAEVGSDDTLCLVSSGEVTVDGLNLYIGDDFENVVGKIQADTANRGLVVNFTYGLALEDCAKVFQCVAYKNNFDYPKRFGERVYLVRFNAGDGAEDSRIQISINVQKPFLYVLPMYRSIKYTDGLAMVHHSVQLGLSASVTLAGGVFEAFISKGLCEEDGIQFVMPKGFTLNEETNTVEIDVAMARQILEQFVVPTPGYNGIFVGQLTQVNDAHVRLDIDRISSVTAKFIPVLVRMVRYRNSADPPQLHTREVTTLFRVPVMKAACALVTEVEVTGVDDMTEVELGAERKAYICLDPPIQLFPNAIVDDNDTPIFNAPFSYLSVEVVTMGTPNDTISMHPSGPVEYDKVTRQLLADNVVIGTLHPDCSDAGRKIFFNLIECPLEVLADTLKMMHFSTTSNVERVSTALVQVEILGGETCPPTKVRFEVPVFPRFLTGYPTSTFRSKFNEVTSQAELFNPNAGLALESMSNVEVTITLWNGVVDTPDESGNSTRPLIFSHDRLVMMKLPSELTYSKGGITDRTSQVRVCTISSTNPLTFNVTFAKTSRTVKPSVYMAILRSIVYECNPVSNPGVVLEESAVLSPRGLPRLTSPKSSGKLLGVLSPRSSMSAITPRSAGGLTPKSGGRRGTRGKSMSVDTCGLVVAETVIRVPVDGDEPLTGTYHTIIDVPHL